MIQMKPDKEAFERVCNLMEDTHHVLNLQNVIDVFGWPMMELVIYLLIDDSKTTYLRDLLEEFKRSQNK